MYFNPSTNPHPDRNQNRHSLRVWLIGALFVLGTAAILIVPLFTAGRVALDAGNVAREDLNAPRTINYDSVILTKQDRDDAERKVAIQYDPLDLRVPRQQVAKARGVLDYMRAVRADPIGSRAEKQALLNRIDNVRLTPEVIDQLLELPEETWQRVAQEVVAVIDSALREEIRDTNVEEMKARLPARVAIDLNEQQTQLVSQIAQNFIIPNRLRNDEATDAARQAARDQVPPHQREIEAGQIIVRQGEIVTDLQIEALDQLGLRQTQISWNSILGYALTALLAALLIGLYIWRFEPHLLTRPRALFLLLLLLLAFLIVAKLMTVNRTVMPFIYPAAAFSMLVAVLVGPGIALTATIVLAGLVGIIANNSFEVSVYTAVGGIVAIWTLSSAEQLNKFFLAGVYVALADSLVILTFRAPAGTLDAVGLLTLIGAATLNGGLAASLTLGGLFLIGNLFDVTTTVQLLELARPTHPLLNELLHKSPGTYHHTLMVANLAEQAAERIGANSLLTRVGAYYHDIGKMIRPYMFVENQVEGANIHDQFNPRTSAEIITSHVTEGIDLAKKYRLPSRVRAFIPEHHGTMRVSFLYQKAIERAPGGAAEVDESAFRYPGPKPQSKETALLMLADGCEATVRANRPASPDQVNELVRKVIGDRIAWGQLDECPLTIADLDKARESFVTTLQGMYHPRLRYPEQEQKTEPSQRVARANGAPLPEAPTANVAAAAKTEESPEEQSDGTITYNHESEDPSRA
ncbi:Cyclic-di-AMP phosphodiesterase PgpH [Thermoflexales bacterium]|nr:Cyclic-di-AMP phosphodiesterase PgpH [Thermoflexales bacterium]